MTPEEFFAILHAAPQPLPAQRRLYHDEQGRVLFYTMEDLPGRWIEVDPLTYAHAPHDVRVIAGKLVPIPRANHIRKLRPAVSGMPCDPRDICLIVSPDQPHVKWSVQPDV